MTDDSAKPNLYWSLASDGLLAILHTASDGLSTADARQHLAQFGPNLLRAREKATALGLLLNQFKSPIILILLFATAVSAVPRLGGCSHHSSERRQRRKAPFGLSGQDSQEEVVRVWLNDLWVSTTMSLVTLLRLSLHYVL
jgi:hypothetical protein